MDHLIQEKKMVADEVVELINDLISDEDVNTSDMLHALKAHIDFLMDAIKKFDIESDF
jgi:hypothetical protein